MRRRHNIKMAMCAACRRAMVFHDDRCEECAGPPEEEQ